MKTTGYALREAIKQFELRRDTAARSFDGSLRKFPDEDKEAPQKIVEQFLKAEGAIVSLQVAQARYNLAVGVEANGEKMSLEEAVKRIGGYARAEKMWRTAAGPKPDRYNTYRNDDERDPTKLVSRITVTPSEAVKLASAAAKRAGALRAAIATGNAREVEIENLDPALFE
jgi:hypothetical protein